MYRGPELQMLQMKQNIRYDLVREYGMERCHGNEKRIEAAAKRSDDWFLPSINDAGKRQMPV